MTGLTDDEIAFLRARLAEAAAAANRGLRFAEGRERDCPDAELVEICERASRREQNYDQPWWAATVMALRQQVRLAPHDPARALREIEALRSVVADCVKALRYPSNIPLANLARRNLASVAAIWSDHPDYREGVRG